MTDQSSPNFDDQMQLFTLLAPGEFEKYRALPPYAQFIVGEALRRKWDGKRPRRKLTVDYLWRRHLQYIERMGKRLDKLIQQSNGARDDHDKGAPSQLEL